MTIETLLEEFDMSRVAETIDRLERDKDALRNAAAAERRRADGLQSQLDAQADKLLDDADLAALDRADHDAESGTPTPTDTVPGDGGTAPATPATPATV